jgi:hypothetical protein
MSYSRKRGNCSVFLMNGLFYLRLIKRKERKGNARKVRKENVYNKLGTIASS